MPLPLPFTRRAKEEPSRPPHCLNCGKPIPSEYTFCGFCGQENEPSPVSFVALLKEGWEEFVKIDAKLLRTLGLLLFRPGYLSAEYVVGRRTHYLSPFKMYVAVSALFFLVFGLLIPFDALDDAHEKTGAALAKAEHSPKKRGDREPSTGMNISLGSAAPTKAPKIKVTGDEEGPAEALSRMATFNAFGMQVNMRELPETVHAYRNSQESLPSYRRDSPVLHLLKERLIHAKAGWGDAVRDLFSTGLPLTMLFQLPLFAAVMRLFYFRQKRLYVEHLVFLLHTHTVFFLLLGTLLAPEALARSLGGHFGLLEHSEPWLGLIGLVSLYNLLALRRFFRQGWGKTLIKAFFLLQAYGFVFIFSSAFAVIGAFLWTLLNG